MRYALQEFEIDKTLNIRGPDDVAKMGIEAYNAECRKIVMRYSNEWESIITRLGRWIGKMKIGHDQLTTNYDTVSKVISWYCLQISKTTIKLFIRRIWKASGGCSANCGIKDSCIEVSKLCPTPPNVILRYLTSNLVRIIKKSLTQQVSFTDERLNFSTF